MRLSGFYDDLILVVGSLTALMAGAFGFFQADLKRVIAFSTCSQLGYMMVSVGLGHGHRIRNSDSDSYSDSDSRLARRIRIVIRRNRQKNGPQRASFTLNFDRVLSK